MHWLYESCGAEDDLEQGDILSPTPQLMSVLRSVHSHFCDPKYVGFAVATQSCDLVRRSSGAKAPYVSIAVVRSLTSVLPKLLSLVSKSVAPGVFRSSSKTSALQFLERLLDQNEQSLGLFYLHPETEIGLGDASVVMLRINIALKSEHYQALIDARKARLSAEFRGKFGWLLGNLYSRIASPDWSDHEGGSKQVERIIKGLLSEKESDLAPRWVDDALIDSALNSGMSFDGTPDDIIARIEKYRPRPKIESIADEIVTVAGKVLAADYVVRKKPRPPVMTSVKPTVVGQVSDALTNTDGGIVAVASSSEGEENDSEMTAALTKIRNRIVNNGAIKKLLR